MLKSLLLKSLENLQSLSFWAASALIDVWGVDDPEVLAALSKGSTLPVNERQNIAHVLPLVMDDKQRCRELLLEIVDAGDQVRADFALRGLGQLAIDSSDTAAADRVFAGGYDGERFVLENEVREVLKALQRRSSGGCSGRARRDGSGSPSTRGRRVEGR